jgi:hypothetical protein
VNLAIDVDVNVESPGVSLAIDGDVDESRPVARWPSRMILMKKSLRTMKRVCRTMKRVSGP